MNKALNLLTENNEKHLDLFACETGFYLAQVYTLLGDRLDPLIKNRIKAKIDDRIINEFLKEKDNSQKYWWQKATLNWASVCAGSIGCTFMLMRPEYFEQVRPSIERTMECYLNGFEDDGFCAEGTGYWDYGFGFFCTYAEMVRIYSEGKINYFANEKVKTISTFIQKMYLLMQERTI